jgi:hypothetical protein
MSSQGSDSAPPGWLEVATSGPVVGRALLYLVIVGALLIAINHGDALLRGEIDGNRLVKILLTPLVPYLVSTFSSVSAIRARTAAEPGSPRRTRG